MASPPEPTFYLTRRGALSGPFALDVLQRLVSAGEIAADDRVRAQDGRDWVRAADHPVLASELAARADLLAKLEGKPGRFAVTLPPSSAPRLPKAGDLVGGKYRIESRLGQGAMGEVFSAENLLTRKRVALKWLRPELLFDTEARRRFSNEARLAARISHPNVIDIYDVVEDEGPFLVMEQLEGESLATLIARQALSRGELLRVLLHAMEGVAAAHKKGVVHRDLKPDNIFVCTDAAGRPVMPKVLDFGISKALTPLREDSSLTAIGVLLGTPYYVPPEQLGHARHVDHRADVYALGVILYECLTGKLPYESRDLPTLLVMIAAGEAASPRGHDPSIPEPLAAIVMKAIAPRPDDRFASVDAMQLALAPYVDEARASMPYAPGAAVTSTGRPAPEGPSLEPTMTYVRRSARKPRAVVGAAVVGIVLGLGSLIVVLRLVTGSADSEPRSVSAAPPASGGQPAARALVTTTVEAPTASPGLTAPSASAPVAPDPEQVVPVATSAEPAAASTSGLALAALRRAARRCGTGEPSASLELHIDARGAVQSTRARGVQPETEACLDRAARALDFGPAPASHALSLVVPLRAARASGAATTWLSGPAAPLRSTTVTDAPEPLVNPYHHR